MNRPDLAPYDPAWAGRFAAEAAAIKDALGSLALAIEHVGSTAVPGLMAKPTIDIAVGVNTTNLPADAVERVKARGFEDAANESMPGERRFRKGRAIPRDVIVHVVEYGGALWRDYVTFRDALRAEPQLVEEYASLKRTLLTARGEWYRGRDKADFIRRVVDRAGTKRAFASSSPEETERLAGLLAAELRVGDVVTVSGELGAGKTTFVRGACRALGVSEPVTSPTFTIGHRYSGRVDVSHLDLYRFTGVSPAEWGDLEPYFDDAVTFVEWPEAAAGELPPIRASVALRHASPTRRMIVFDGEKALLDRLFRGC